MATLQCTTVLLSAPVASETSASTLTSLNSPSARAMPQVPSFGPASMYSKCRAHFNPQSAHLKSSFLQTSLNNSVSHIPPAEMFLVKAGIRAQQVQFKANRAVTIPFREGAFPANDYLKETERIVQVTFPDSTRIEYLGDQKWRARLRPITFISVSATPTVEMRVSFEKGALRLHSNKLFLDFSGVPDSFAVANFSFSLNGNLRVIPRSSNIEKVRRGCDFSGSVSLGLMTDLPMAFALVPKGVLTGVGDEILDRIIGAMEGALLKGIISDYNSWCRMKSKKMAVKPTQPVIPLRTSTT